jgi:hypothetical protein
LTPLKRLTYGAIVNFFGAPFALPYLTVINEVGRAKLSTTASMSVLAKYNDVYALPFLLVPRLMVGLGLWLLPDVYDDVSADV